jgi:hypothetical protein
MRIYGSGTGIKEPMSLKRVQAMVYSLLVTGTCHCKHRKKVFFESTIVISKRSGFMKPV